MSLQKIDMSRLAVDVFKGEPVKVAETMFGGVAISKSAEYLSYFADHLDQASLGLIRWPGGTMAENGTVLDNGGVSLLEISGRPAAYDLTYPELLHPALLKNIDGTPSGRPSLSDMLSLAVQEQATFSMILPTERYVNTPAKAYDDVAAFLKRLFVDRAFNDGILPNHVVLDIGNEHYVPETYGPIAAMMLAAVRDFRAENVSIQFDVALQAMQTGSESINLVSEISNPDWGPEYANLLSEVAALRIHSLNHGLESISQIEDRSATYWSLRRMIEGIEKAREAHGGPSTDVGLYVSAFTTNSDDIQQGLSAGLPSAGAMLSLFTGLLELGADQAAAWGIAKNAASETAMSFVASDGSVKLTPAGTLYSLMASSIVGTQLLYTPSMDSGRQEQYNLYAFRSDNASVFYICANDLVDGRLDVALEMLNGLPIIDFSVTALSASEGIWGQGLLAPREATLSGTQIQTEIRGDYEVLQVVVSHQDVLPDGQMRISGDANSNKLVGTSFSDRISGLSGNDTLLANGGNDTLDGGGGVDLVDFRSVASAMRIDLSKGSILYDEFELKVISIERVIAGSGTNKIIGSSTHDFIVGGRMADGVLGGQGNDRLEGLDGNDGLSGGLGDDFILGGAGNDYILGGADNDRLFGGFGRDTIQGGVGSDIIEGGEAGDFLSGGQGSDVFVFGARSGADVITDFDCLAGDRLDFSRIVGGPRSLDALRGVSKAIGGDLELRFNESDSLLLTNFSFDQFQSDSFVF